MDNMVKTVFSDGWANDATEHQCVILVGCLDPRDEGEPLVAYAHNLMNVMMERDPMRWQVRPFKYSEEPAQFVSYLNDIIIQRVKQIRRDGFRMGALQSAYVPVELQTALSLLADGELDRFIASPEARTKIALSESDFYKVSDELSRWTHVIPCVTGAFPKQSKPANLDAMGIVHYQGRTYTWREGMNPALTTPFGLLNPELKSPDEWKHVYRTPGVTVSRVVHDLSDGTLIGGGNVETRY